MRLAKVNIDENPGIAQQFRVQSIPAVFVIDQGKAFQGFTGALPDSQVKAFIDELAAGAGGERRTGSRRCWRWPPRRWPPATRRRGPGLRPGAAGGAART